MDKEEAIKKIKESGVHYQLGPIFDSIADPYKMSDEMINDVAETIYEFLKEGNWLE